MHVEAQWPSSGTHATDGFPPSIEAQIACYVNDIDISKHSAKVMTSEIAQNSDIILVMARHHIDWLAENFGSQIISKAYLLTEYGREENIKGEDIKDPITMPPEHYKGRNRTGCKLHLKQGESLIRKISDIDNLVEYW
jgi:protein-tyrosine-phosphatase